MRPLALLLAASFGCGPPPCGPLEAMVAEVIDGDTVVLESGEKVRYLLVDTAEVTGGKNDCYGVEAREFNRSLVLGKTVQLRYDADACTDRFGRLLAYLTVGGREINTALVEGGYACVLYVAPGGEERKAEFENFESIAKSERRGLWGVCASSPCGG